jgi:hypothetical protein
MRFFVRGSASASLFAKSPQGYICFREPGDKVFVCLVGLLAFGGVDEGEPFCFPFQLLARRLA